MDHMQLIIIAVVVILILITIGYYLFQESKFKKLVENNFNQAIDDIITDENKPFILDGVDENIVIETKVMVKDKHNKENSSYIQDPLFSDAVEAKGGVNGSQKITYTIEHPIEQAELSFDDVPSKVHEHPSDSVEAFFAAIHQVPFPFGNDVSIDIDVVVDIGFEEPIKLKVIPNIAEFTNKPFKVYVLTKNREWYIFEKGQKLVGVRALKFVVQLIDNEGLISQTQVERVFSELHRFAMQNHAYIYKPDYLVSIDKLKTQMSYLEKIVLNLKLFLILNVNHSYLELSKYLHGVGLVESAGVFSSVDSHGELFTITDESGEKLQNGKSYNLLQISSNLHLHKNPNAVIEKIFDFAENFMMHYESRLLTTNKKVLSQKDYNQIIKHVEQYVEGAKTYDIELGGRLIRRLFL